MDKNKKILLIAGIVEAIFLIFALVVSIIVWTTIAPTTIDGRQLTEAEWEAENLARNGAFIAFFQNNRTAFFCIICVPIFVIVAVDFVYFAVIANKKESVLTEEQKEEIKRKAREEFEAELKAEAMKEAEGQKK